MVLEFDNWDKWKNMALKHFGDKHIDIIKKLETIQIQDYEAVDEFIDAYRALARLSICRELQKGNCNNKIEVESDFNSGISLTFFKRAIPIKYRMAIEERNIKDLIDTYDLVEKFFRIKVENLPDEKAKKASPWNPFSKKVTKEPEPDDLSNKLTEALRAFMAMGKQHLTTIMDYALIVDQLNTRPRIARRNVATSRKITPVETASSKKLPQGNLFGQFAFG
ncbi:hypothetical protein DSO57_1002132 [Entomophthora muscae]|uniref:Uncharacterized protein n=1 Tax=Entomophthora muscae TaxID=34485 RepID=A0ACC2TX15_9FUNG|nr:hypothetical protein DSO57_1002132 [Entomophthora muscae]